MRFAFQLLSFPACGTMFGKLSGENNQTNWEIGRHNVQLSSNDSLQLKFQREQMVVSINGKIEH